ncbi:MAG: hypothetical protein HRT38_00260 [Alteromonadaceae bacterium]|nr:hypothetical protein [Alteromonadaceae bacterium]
MENVPIAQWGSIEIEQDVDYQVFLFPDLDTINKDVDESKDLSLALQVVARSLYDYEKQVLATQRNQDNDAWLALCI